MKADFILMLFPLGFVLFIALMFQTDDPRYWNDREVPDINTYSSFRKIFYDKDFNVFRFSIYNGNYNEFMKQQETCKDFISWYRNQKGYSLEEALSTFYVRIRCCVSEPDCVETNIDHRDLVIPFNTTYHNIIVDSPFSPEKNNNLCSIRLFSNFIGRKEHGCFLSIREPLFDVTIHDLRTFKGDGV